MMIKLDEMRQKHRQGVYYLHHWTGIINGSVTARQACRRIEQRLREFSQEASKYERAHKGILEIAQKAQLLINDLWHLSTDDFEQLQSFTPTQLLEETKISILE